MYFWQIRLYPDEEKILDNQLEELYNRAYHKRLEHYEKNGDGPSVR